METCGRVTRNSGRKRILGVSDPLNQGVMNGPVSLWRWSGAEHRLAKSGLSLTAFHFRFPHFNLYSSHIEHNFFVWA